MSNKHVSQRFFELFGIQHDVEGCTPLFTEDVVVVSAAGQWQSMDLDTYKGLGYAYLAGIPNLTVKVVEQIEEGDKVVSRVVWSGTHTGKLMDFPASGRSFSNESILIDHFRNGRIAERFEVSDNMNFGQQLGLIPPAPQA